MKGDQLWGLSRASVQLSGRWGQLGWINTREKEKEKNLRVPKIRQKLNDVRRKTSKNSKDRRKGVSTTHQENPIGPKVWERPIRGKRNLESVRYLCLGGLGRKGPIEGYPLKGKVKREFYLLQRGSSSIESESFSWERMKHGDFINLARRNHALGRRAPQMTCGLPSDFKIHHRTNLKRIISRGGQKI